MATQTYQHWIGKMVVEAGDRPAVTHKVDAWFPAAKPAGATLIAQDLYPTPTDLFADVINLKVRWGPIQFRVHVDLAFTGTVEHWQAPVGSDGNH